MNGPACRSSTRSLPRSAVWSHVLSFHSLTNSATPNGNLLDSGGSSARSLGTCPPASCQASKIRRAICFAPGVVSPGSRPITSLAACRRRGSSSRMSCSYVPISSRRAALAHRRARWGEHPPGCDERSCCGRESASRTCGAEYRAAREISTGRERCGTASWRRSPRTAGRGGATAPRAACAAPGR